MPYITREDGIHFVIPSYRDVLVVKESALKKEVQALSQNYGEYITMQRQGATQFDVAFSPDTGYLLGETVWHHFNRPMDMIYCEVMPNTAEAILVIVKGGSVYLDGVFPLESIPEELLIFLTQQNNFEIYVYGDVPLAEKPTDGKFSFDTSSIKSYTTLDQPVFKSLPLIKSYNFQLVDVVLKEQGIGVLPVKNIVIIGGILVLGWFLYSALFATREEQVEVVEANPYQVYVDTLASPAPDQVIQSFVDTLKKLYAAPGWSVTTILYKEKTIEALMRSSGSNIEELMKWCADNKFGITIKPIGIVISAPMQVQNRSKPKQIYKIDEVLANFIDKLAKIYPGNSISLADVKKSDSYTSIKISIGLNGVSPMVLSLIGEQMKGMPFNMKVISMAMTNELLNGAIEVELLGN